MRYNLQGIVPVSLLKEAMKSGQQTVAFNFDIEVGEGANDGIIEGTIESIPNSGDRGMSREWVDIQNVGGRYTLSRLDY